MPRKKTTSEEEEARKILEQLVGTEKAEEIAGYIATIAESTGKSFKEVIKEMLESTVVAHAFQKLTAPDLVACATFLKYLDILFFSRVYATSPMEAVIRQADQYSEAVRKILEAQAGGLQPIIERVLEERLGRIEKRLEEAKKEKGEEEKKEGNRLLERAIDKIMGIIAEEIGARVGPEVAETLAPPLRDKILEAIRKGEIIVKLGEIE